MNEKQYLPLSTVKTMYKSLVEPHCRYCCPIWGNAGVTVIEKLQKLQNRAAKLVTNSSFDATALPVIRALQWPTVRELIDFESQRMVFRSLKGDAPSYMKDMFTRVNNSTARSLRSAEVDLRLPLLKSAGGQKQGRSYIGGTGGAAPPLAKSQSANQLKVTLSRQIEKFLKSAR